MDPEGVGREFLEQFSHPDVLKANPGLSAVHTTTLNPSGEEHDFQGDEAVRHYTQGVGQLYAARLQQLGLKDNGTQQQLEAQLGQRVRSHAIDTLAKRMRDEGEVGRGSKEYISSRVLPFESTMRGASDALNLQAAGERFGSGKAYPEDYLNVARRQASQEEEKSRGLAGKTFDVASQLPVTAAEWLASGGSGALGEAAAGAGIKAAATRAGQFALGTAARQAPVSVAKGLAEGLGSDNYAATAAKAIAGHVVESGVFGALDPFHVQAGTNYVTKVLTGLGKGVAAVEGSAELKALVGSAPQGGAVHRWATAKTPEERQAAITDLLAEGAGFGLFEAGMHLGAQSRRGLRVDAEKAASEGVRSLLETTVEKEKANATPANAPGTEAGPPPGTANPREAVPQEQGAPVQGAAQPGPEAAPGANAQPVPGAERNTGGANAAAAPGQEPGAQGPVPAAGAGVPPGGEGVLSPAEKPSQSEVVSPGRVEELRQMLDAVGQKTGRMSDEKVVQEAQRLKLDQFQPDREGMGAASLSVAPGAVRPEAPGAATPEVPERAAAKPVAGTLQQSADWLKSFSQQTYPSLTRLSPATGEKLAQASNAPTAAKDAWNYFGQTLKVNGKPLADMSPEEARLVGSVWLERRMRQFAEHLAAAGKPEEAKQVATLVGQEGSPLKTEEDYRQGLEGLWSFFEGVKQEWTPTVEKNYRGLTGLEPDDAIDSPSQIPGLPLNAIGIPEGQELPGAVRTGTRGMENLRVRKPGFTRAAGLDAPAYDVDVRHMMQRTLDLGLPAARRAEFLRTALQEGVVKAVGGSDPPPEKSYDAQSNGRYVANTATHAEPPRGWHYAEKREQLPEGWAFLERDPGKAPEGWKYLGLDPAKGLSGIDPNARYYAHPDAYQNIVQGLGIGERPGAILSGAANFFGKLNATALVSPVEFATHVGNQLTAMFRPGMGVPGLNILTDTVPNMWRVWSKDPEMLRKIWDLSSISASFHHEARAGRIPVLNRVQQFTTGVIDVMQKAVRVQLGEAYDRMADKGLFEGSETGKRDFINQAVGNYNAQASNRVQQFLKDSGIQPFATAAATFATQGVKSGYTGAVNAPSAPGKLLQNHAVALAKFLPFMALAPVVNLLRWGQAFPQNTPAFAIKTREDDDGKLHYFDPLAFTGQRRGWRVTGGRAVAEGVIDKKSAGEIADRAARDMVSGVEHLAGGPAVQFVHTALTGEDALGRKVAKQVSTAKTQQGQEKAVARGAPPAGSSQSWQNLKAALLNINGIVGAVTDADRPKTPHTVAEKVFQTLGPFGERSRQADLASNITADLSDKPALQAQRDRWLAELVTRAYHGDGNARKIIAEAKVPQATQVELLRKLRAEESLSRRGLSPAAAKARVWGLPGDPGERKAPKAVGQRGLVGVTE